MKTSIKRMDRLVRKTRAKAGTKYPIIRLEPPVRGRHDAIAYAAALEVLG